MADNEESSVMFSLKELMNLEEDRIKSEEEERLTMQRDEERARLDGEQRGRDAEAARLHAEAERRRQEEQRGREEQARLEAIGHAELERVRAETEQRARMEGIARQQEHERQLLTLKQDQRGGALRNQLIGVSVVAILGLGGLGYFLYDQSNKAAQAKSVAAAETRQRADEAEAMKKQLAIQEADRKLLQEQLSASTTPEEKARLQAKIDELATANKGSTGTPSVRQYGTGVTTTTTPTAPVSGHKACKKGDPLCSDL